MSNTKNSRLRNAIAAAHLDAGQVAEELKVDSKTVQRWLSGRVPQTRLRWALASLVEEDEEYLWPSVSRGPSADASATEILAAYPRRVDLTPPRWWEMFESAQRQIDLFGSDLAFLSEQHPDLVELLTKKAKESCRIRFCISSAGSAAAKERDTEQNAHGDLLSRIGTGWTAFGILSDSDGIAFRAHKAPQYNSMYRFDDQMLVTMTLYGEPDYRSPLIRLRRLGPTGLFESFGSQFERAWSAAEPILGGLAGTDPELLRARIRKTLSKKSSDTPPEDDGE